MTKNALWRHNGMAQLKPLSACQYQGWLANSVALCHLQCPRPLHTRFPKGAVYLSVCDEAGMCFTKTVCFNQDRDSVVEMQMRNKHFEWRLSLLQLLVGKIPWLGTSRRRKASPGSIQIITIIFQVISKGIMHFKKMWPHFFFKRWQCVYEFMPGTFSKPISPDWKVVALVRINLMLLLRTLSQFSTL